MQQHQFRLQQQHQQQQQQQQQFNNQQRRFPQGNGYVFRGGAVRGGRGGGGVGGGGGGGGQWYSNNSGHSSAASSASFSAGSPSRQSSRFSRRHPSRDHLADDSISGSSVETGEEEGTTGAGSQQPLSKPQEEVLQEESKEELPKDGDIMIFNRNVYLMTVGDQGSGFYLQGQAIPEFAEHAGILKVDDATRETILMTAKNSKSL